MNGHRPSDHSHSTGNLWSSTLCVVFADRHHLRCAAAFPGSAAGATTETLTAVQSAAAAAVRRRVELPLVSGGQLSTLFQGVNRGRRWSCEVLRSQTAAYLLRLR